MVSGYHAFFYIIDVLFFTVALLPPSLVKIGKQIIGFSKFKIAAAAILVPGYQAFSIS